MIWTRFPLLKAMKYFIPDLGSLLNIVLVLAGDGILKFHGPHSGEWGGILHPTSNINFVTFTRRALLDAQEE